MTQQEKIQQELRQAKHSLAEVKERIEEATAKLKWELDLDAYGMTPGLCTNHAGLELSALGTRFRDLQNMISMLEWFLRDDN